MQSGVCVLCKVRRGAVLWIRASHMELHGRGPKTVGASCALELGMGLMRVHMCPRVRPYGRTHRHGGVARLLALGRGLGTVDSPVGLETGHSGQSSPVVSGRDGSRDRELDHRKGARPNLNPPPPPPCSSCVTPLYGHAPPETGRTGPADGWCRCCSNEGPCFVIAVVCCAVFTPVFTVSQALTGLTRPASRCGTMSPMLCPSRYARIHQPPPGSAGSGGVLEEWTHRIKEDHTQWMATPRDGKGFRRTMTAQHPHVGPSQYLYPRPPTPPAPTRVWCCLSWGWVFDGAAGAGSVVPAMSAPPPPPSPHMFRRSSVRVTGNGCLSW